MLLVPGMLKVEIAGGNLLDAPAWPQPRPFTSSEDRRTQQLRGGGNGWQNRGSQLTICQQPNVA